MYFIGHAFGRTKEMKHPRLTLISHHLCPYVQRAAIALLEQDLPFERRNIDLGNKPDWFLEISPLGKVPVLVVDDDAVLFESSVIAQYVDELTGGGLLSSELLEKSQQLAWMEFASQVVANIGHLYSAPTNTAFETAENALKQRLQRVESTLGTGQWFSGNKFTLVDAAFAPAFRYFDVIDNLLENDVFSGTPKVARWRRSLSERVTVKNAVGQDYYERLLTFLSNRDSVIGRAAREEIVERSQAA
jgi:glutathione S-transferase